MDPAIPQPPALGEHGEACEGCESPLAADQRYCLNCGARRAGPRVDYRHYMGSATGLAPPVPEPVAVGDDQEQPPKGERDYAPLAAVGGIAVLGLMLLVGVLIGKGDSPSQTSAPAPIVRVAAPATADESTGPVADAGKPAGDGAKKSAPKTGAEQVEGGLTGTAARNSQTTVQATTDDLEALEESTGEDYEETVKKLPDKIATPGAPPPIDKSKAPGGGGGAETIE